MTRFWQAHGAVTARAHASFSNQHHTAVGGLPRFETTTK